MAKKMYSIIFLSIFMLYPLNSFSEEQAVVIVPVADLFSQSLKNYNKQHKTNLTHATIPISGKNENKACPRLHQVLFNEIVTILEEQKDEVKVQLLNHFCQTEQSNTKQSTYWMAKENLMPLDHLKKNNIDLSVIPQPIVYTNQQMYYPNVITLKQPFTDTEHTITYSVGTRFVKTETQPHKHYTTVYALNPTTKNVDRIAIPTRLCTVYHENINKRVDEFVAHIRSLAHQKKGFIPYVWGGCSFTSLSHNHPFAEKNDKDNNPYFQRNDRSNGVQNGFDCSGLILRGTQLCGIPYFYKNSTTLLKNLTPLTSSQEIENGDILWFTGHVIIVSDVKNNLVVEARGYEHGYGILHETSLNKQFKNIETFEVLKKAYLEQKPLDRLDKFGGIPKTITNYKILKLKSVWSAANNNR